MHLNRPLQVLALIVLMILSSIAWFKFAYPKFTLIDLSVTRPQAAQIARDYVRSVSSVDLNSYKQSVIFDSDSMTDLYLQKSIGPRNTEEFLTKHNFEMYFWTVRLFKESQKEEYRVSVSSKTGEIIAYLHILDDATARSKIDEGLAKEKAKEFLRTTFHYDLNDWAFNQENKTKYDNRLEHRFTWEKKNVYIPWDPGPDQGGGKLLSVVTITGDEVQSFVRLSFLVPEQFNRYVERRKESGRNLGLIANLSSIALVIAAIWIILVRRNALCMNVTKNFYIYVIGVLFVLTIVSAFNNAQGYLFSYPTTQPFTPYFVRQAIYEFIDRFLFFGCFIVPCLAGELLRFESFPKRPWMSMYHYVTTTFLTRDVAKAVLLGYCFAVLMFGLQTAIFEFGYRYCDVWAEQERLSTFSTAYFPFFGVLMVALTAGITEETFYRLFGFNLFYNLTRKSLIAFLVPSIIWGLGHTGYLVFPFWFRGLEIAILGVFTCFVYRRFGLITVVIQHYLFDAFWGGSVYIFAKSTGINFWMSFLILLLPVVFAAVAFVCNRPVRVPEVQWNLNKLQKYNLVIIKGFVESRKNEAGFNADSLRQELIANGWDIAVVDVAFIQLKIPISPSKA